MEGHTSAAQISALGFHTHREYRHRLRTELFGSFPIDYRHGLDQYKKMKENC